MNANSVVVDTNLIFSALIPKASRIRDILFDDSMTFYSPNFLITEIYSHNAKLKRYSKLNDSDFYLYFNGIIERIKFIPTEIIGIESRQRAYEFCMDIDIKDTPFIALSIDLNIPFWTGDKKLKDGLRLKGFSNFYEI